MPKRPIGWEPSLLPESYIPPEELLPPPLPPERQPVYPPEYIPPSPPKEEWLTGPEFEEVFGVELPTGWDVSYIWDGTDTAPIFAVYAPGGEKLSLEDIGITPTGEWIPSRQRVSPTGALMPFEPMAEAEKQLSDARIIEALSNLFLPVGLVEPDRGMNIESLIEWATANPDAFLSTIQSKGLTSDTIDLLEGMYPGVTPEEIEQFFEQEQVAITEDGASQSKGFLGALWDSILMGGRHLLHTSTQYFVSTFPNAFYKDVKAGENVIREISTGLPITLTYTEEEAARLNAHNKLMRDKFRAIYASNEAKQEKWLEKHKDLQPPSNYLESPIDNPELWTDPGWWGWAMGTSAAFSVAIIGTTLGVTYITKNPFAGIASGMIFATPSASQDLYEELRDAGAPEDAAAEIAVPVGMFMGFLEGIGNLPIFAAVWKGTKVIGDTIKRETIRGVVSRLLKRGVWTGIQELTSETLTEVAQQTTQNAFVKIYDENREIFQDIDTTIIRTLIATAPFALFGGGMSMRHVSSREAATVSPEDKKAEGWEQDKNTGEWYKPAKILDMFNEDVTELTEAGLEPDQAKVKALNEAARTPEGEKAIKEAVKKIKEGVPVEPEMVVPEAVPEAKPEVAVEEDIYKQTHKLLEISEAFSNKTIRLDTAKSVLSDYVNKTMPAQIRGKMLASMKDVKTEDDVRKAIELANKYMEQYSQRVFRGQINKELKRTKAKKYEGILKGKYTPEVQRKLDIVRDNLDVDRDTARGKISDNMNAYERGEISYEEMLEANELLDMAGTSGMSAQELGIVVENIKSLKQYGRTVREEARAKEKERIDEIKDNVIDVITGGKGLKPGVGTVPTKQLEETRGWLEKLVNWQYSLTNLMDKLSKFHKSKPYQSPLSRFVDNAVLRSRDSENMGLERSYNELRENLNKIFKTTKRSQANQILNKFHDEAVELGTFKNLDGEVVTLRLTKDQIMNKYQQLQDPTLEGTFRDGMRWGAEIQTAITNNLSEQEKAWADYQMEFYQKYYTSINEIYANLYGVDLPHNLNYSPIRRDLEAEVPENVLTYRDMSRYASVLNGSLKSRVANKIPLRFNGATEILMNHVMQMEHFKAWAYTMRDLRRVLGAKEVRTAIRQYHGQPVLKTIDGYLNDMARGGIEKALINRGADFLRRNFVRAILGIKPSIALKQIPSVVAYSTEMPLGDFVSGVADFWTNPLQHYRFMLEHSPYMRQRFGRGFERDIKFAMETKPARTLSGKGNAKDWFMTLIRQGDKFAVSQGMWAKYTSSIKAGFSQEEAILEAEKSTRRTQPTFDIETLSPLQKGGSWMKLLTMFQNQPNKYFRIMADNARNFQYGRGNRAKAASNIFLVWVIAPALFQLIADGFQFKKEHQLRAWVLGPLNWLLVAGQMAQSVYGWITDEPYDYQASPVLQTFRDIQVVFQKARKIIEQHGDPYKDISMDDVIAAVEYFAKAAGELLGYPTPWLVQAERGIREGEPLEIIFSRWSLRKPEKDNHTKAKDAVGNLGRTILDIDLASDDVDKRRAAEEKLRVREEAEAKGLTVEPLEVYDIKDLDRDFRSIYGDVLPDDIIADPKASKEAKAWAEKEKSQGSSDILPNIPLYQINTDTENEDTIIQYYKQWQAREGIDNLVDLKAFDKLYPKAYLGNVSRIQYDLLVKYLNTPDNKKAAFLEEHPELKVNPRNEWLKGNPIDNAKLALWGQAKLLSLDAYNEFNRLVKGLDIPEDTLAEFTLPPKASVENYFAYNEILEERTWNSWEAQLLLAKDDVLREWLGHDPIETPVEALELLVKNRELSDTLAGYSDEGSPLYIEDEDEREKAIDALKAANPEWVDDMRRVEAYRQLAPDDKVIEDYVEYGRIIDSTSPSSIEARLFKLEHPEMFEWGQSEDAFGWDDLSDDNIDILRLRVKFNDQFEYYEKFNTDEQRQRYLDANPEFQDAFYRVQAYNEGYSESNWNEFVEFSKLPIWGDWRERFLLKNEDLYNEWLSEEVGQGHQRITESEVSPAKRDEIYLQFMEQFKAWEDTAGLTEKQVKSMRERLLERNPGFAEARLRVDAYDDGVAEEFIDNVVEYRSIPSKGYANERYLKAHKEFYKAVWLGVWGNKKIDFSQIPSEKEEKLLNAYDRLDAGAPRLAERCKDKDMDDAVVKYYGLVPAYGTDRCTDVSEVERPPWWNEWWEEFYEVHG